MNKIRILNDAEIKAIAAGEVVEKPASVVKELLENACDADAKNITVFIWQGGCQKIKIIDDGIGMNEEELLTAILPHATSKLKDITTLYSGITSYGFRGEALSSIIQISNTTIFSKTQYTSSGNTLHIKYGIHEPMMPCAMQQGTTIIVENLFDNCIVRKKYLKSR